MIINKMLKSKKFFRKANQKVNSILNVLSHPFLFQEITKKLAVLMKRKSYKIKKTRALKIFIMKKLTAFKRMIYK